MSNLTANSVSLTVGENAIATAIAFPAPTDTNFPASALTVTVTALPSDGVVLFADGVTPVSIGETLTVDQLTGLRFRPILNGASLSSTFAFTVADPSGQTASATATLTIGASKTPLLATWTSLVAPQKGAAEPIGIQAPVDVNFAASSLTAKITAVPSDGTVTLSNGTAVTVGETLTVAQLTGLMFLPGTGGAQTTSASDLTYTVSDPAGASVTGVVLLETVPDAPPTTTPTALTVAQNSPATPIGIQAPTDANYAASALSVKATGLPTDGSIVLSDGITAVTLGESLTVAQLTGLEFIAKAGTASQTSSFTYSVTDPSGSSGTGVASLAIGASNTPLVTTLTSLTVDENADATAIGIAAPSDANFAGSQLGVTITALPTNGAVLLTNGSPVTLGESLTVAQLTGLSFLPTLNNTGQSSTFSYSVSDPAGHNAAGTVALTTGPNPIVIENEKPGTPESVWQIDPGADSTTIQGFTTEISTNVGGTVDFKINNQTGNPNYQINIYRLGYYGGDGATLYASIQHQANSSVVQPAPIVDPTTGEVDAGNWQVTDSWTIPSNATSGVFVANIIDGSQTFQIPFIVRDDSSRSDIVFQTDDETWQAYNGWGGANLYGGDGPSNPPGGGEAVPGAAYAVSYNRPIVTRDSTGQYSGPQDMVFGAEYSAIQWMEENGYDVSYLSGMDTATDGSLLLNHQVFMDAGHDEYWTDSQVANVEAAKNAGVNLVFLSGNEVFWQTQFGPSIDGSSSANRTLESYKDSHFESVINPTGQGTGAFEAPTSWGGLNIPSNALTGELFSVDQTPTLGTITVPYDMTQLRFWRNTSVAATAPGQTASLEPGLLGYEWDSSPDNGFMPAGLVDLSSTTLQEPTVNTEFGNVDTTGTATNNLVEYRDPTSGALVFGAGTVFWSWGLSADHDPGPDGNSTTTDPNVQQAMVNLFADMGVQPSTLQATLVLATESTDHTPPTSHITSVSTTNVVEGGTVTVSGTASDVGGVVAAVQISTDGGATWHVTSGQIGSQSVTWTYSFNAPAPGNYTIETRAADDSLNLETPTDGVPYTATPSSALSLFSTSDTPVTANVNDPNSVEVGVKFTSATNGEITGIRFYKGPQNTGTHIGDLWSATGTLLASATFTNETASGWQQVNFTTPVKITAGTTYIASYHMTDGNYSDTPDYFDTYSGQANGSLTAPGEAENGAYAYGASSVFPSNIPDAGDNYWVDVVFNDTTDDPQATDKSGFITSENNALTIPVSTLLANDTDPLGFALSFKSVGNATNGTATYNSAAQTVTFTPTAGYVGPANFTYTIGDTNGGSASANVSLTVQYPVNAQSLFNPGDTPAVITENDTSSVELGVKFQPSVTGTITGIRFYKGPQNTGTHIGDLWTSTGTLLATATFTNETASGWQQVNLATPVVVTAGTTYVVSYHTSGDYSATSNFFATADTNEDLTAPSNGASSGNGVYAYGASPAFPTNNFNATNYWVDVVFNGSPLSPPVAKNDSLTGVENSTLSIPASTLLANDTDPYNLPLSISGVSNPTNGAVSFNASTQTVSFTPTSGYTGSAGFTYTIADGEGDSASANVALAITPPPPIANNESGFVTSENTAVTIPVSTILANDSDPDGFALSLTSVSNATDGAVTYNSSAQTVTFTPTAGYVGPANFNYTIGDTNGGSASANVSLTVQYPVNAQSLFNPGDTPAAITENDPSSVELGMKFDPSVTGTITGIRFYKGPQNTGTHIGNLWSSTGSLLATATFSNETASGWQQVNLATPVVVTAGTTYVVSYHTNGDYSATPNYFATSDTNEELTAPASGTSGGNGVYAYGSSPVFPTNTYNATNYSVDVVFNGSSLRPPVANNDSLTGVENTTLSIPASTLLANDTDPYNLPLSITGVTNPTNGAVSYSASTQTVSFTPTAGYTGSAAFTYAITDGQGDAASANVALTINAASPVVNNAQGLVASENTTLSIPVSTLLANDSDPDGFPLSITGVSNPTNGAVTYNASAQTVSFVPTSGYTGTASFTYSVTDGHGGAGSASADLVVNDPSTESLFSLTSSPAIATINDTNSVELGVKFQASENGTITGIRFYKGPANAGPHVADLWNSSGTLLATAPFTNETAGGWQQVNFSSPVTITAGTTYVASYHTSGEYSADPNLFASALANGDLTAPSNAASGGNGLYAYGSGSLFPTSSFNATSYGVDVIFKPQLAA